MDLEFTESTVDDWMVIHASGEVDLHTATDLSDRLLAAIDNGTTQLVVDLTDIGFIDSTGLGALVAAHNGATEHGVSMHVVCPSERLLKLFRITGLHEVFAIYPSVAQAVGEHSNGMPSTAG